LNDNIKIADGSATGEVANGAADQKHGEIASAGNIANRREGLLLGWSKSGLEQVNIICHEVIVAPSWGWRPCGRLSDVG
jgi:hypothetical protein